MKSAEIRKIFLDFFNSKGHLIVPSAPLVAKNDPTLMFNNSGMAQFKDYFLGNGLPPSKRIADTQRCLRVSGKHNDLEDVGFDTYHNTMFEMLGNWSFGDYFKKEALLWAWELLTEVYGIPKDRIYVTVFGGDDKENISLDQEALDIWRNILGGESHIIFGSKKDNFWEMGEVGPCGPCSEIHIDVRDESEIKKISGGDLVNKDHPQVVEVWNIVFMQFERKANGSLVNLPDKHVDTGMGFERISMVLQGKKSIYDTDIFQGTIATLKRLSGRDYSGNSNESEPINYQDVSMRIIADHVRAVAFAIADGQLPSNSKAGYVIRRILRRAIRYGYSYLGFRKPFMAELIPGLAEQFALVFPELKNQSTFVIRVIEEEEKSFLNTLSEGLNRIEKIISDPIANSTKKISGKQAFELSDTFGFPLDLTALIARENHFSIDTEGFEKELTLQKERSRKDAQKEPSDWIDLDNTVSQEFLGHSNEEAEAQLVKYRIVKTKKGIEYQLVLDKTPFYAEMGGQVGDTGTMALMTDSGIIRTPITNTIRESGLIVHISIDETLGETLRTLSKPIKVLAAIDHRRRADICNNHTATHLMLGALRVVLGNHVIQRGSYLNDQILRFDFSHITKVSDEEIQRIEDIVNRKIWDNIESVIYPNMNYNDAINIGATATFGEKYGDIVRVVIFDPAFSIELCGGTHVSSTGKIGLFKIISESSVSAGVRRIEALTSQAAFNYLNESLLKIKRIKEIVNSVDIIKSVEGLLLEKSVMQKRIDSFENAQLEVLKGDLLKRFNKENGINVLSEVINVSSAQSLKFLAREIQRQIQNSFIVLGAVIESKPQLIIAMDDEVIKLSNLNASSIIKQVSKEIKGTGGGQPTLASGGGIYPEGLEIAITSANILFQSAIMK